jgi:hypothetical protein
MLNAFPPPAITRLTAACGLRILLVGPELAGRPRTARRTLSLPALPTSLFPFFLASLSFLFKLP